MKKAVVINASHPEVNNIAIALDRRGLLLDYYRPYTVKNRIIDRLILRIANDLASNRKVNDINLERVREVGLISDLLWLLGNRLKNKLKLSQKRLDNFMHYRTVSVSRIAAKRIGNPDIVIGDIGTALDSFKKVKSALKILNHPIARHSFSNQYLRESAAFAGGFADTFDITESPKWMEDRIDSEIAMADIILVGSSFAKDSFVRTGVPEKKVKVIAYGVDLSVFRPKKREFNKNKPLRMIFVGKIGERKGISYLNDAFSVLKDEGISLTVVGDAIGGQRTLNLLDKDIKHIPHLSHRELSDLYFEHDVFVFPTLIEGMGLVVLEAMASGLAVLTTPNGPGDIVRDGIDGIHIEPRSVESIISAARYVNSNRELMENMGNSSMERAKEYSWKNYQSHFISIIDQIS